MIIRLVKSIEIQLETDNVEEAMMLVDIMDSEGVLELYAEYYNAETGELLN